MPYRQRGLTTLTLRDLEILNLVMEGLESAEIGELVHLAPKTIKNHLSRIYDKLGASNRVEAVIIALRGRLLQL